MTEIPAEQLIAALREQNAQLAYQVAVLTAQNRVLLARLGEEADHE